MNIAGAMELTMACATAGLVLGSVLGGPLAEYLVRRYTLAPAAAPTEALVEAANDDTDQITVSSALNTLFAILACFAGGKELAHLVTGTGFILSDFLFCLLLGVAIRNAGTLMPKFRVSTPTVGLLGLSPCMKA